MARNSDVIQYPVVQTTVILELQRTDGMGDPFQRIGNAVGEVVHRVDAPLVAGLMVLSKLDTVDNRIAHHDERRGHVDFGTQTRATFGKLTIFHLLEQRQVLFYAAITIRAVFTRLSQGAAVFAHLLSSQLIHIRQTFLDQLNRILMQLIKIVG